LKKFARNKNGSSLIKLIDFSIKGDSRGSLVALEASREVPFSIARVYYIFGTQPGVSRGLHAHKSLQQLCIAVCGSLRMVLDDGVSRTEVTLDRPNRGLLIDPGVWNEMHDLSADCVVMVLTDAPYKEADYIRNYEKFLRHTHSSHR
jgi:dTDP-4-dehydrorhamnose 3,5-epimerase-like enzyme